MIPNFKVLLSLGVVIAVVVMYFYLIGQREKLYQRGIDSGIKQCQTTQLENKVKENKVQLKKKNETIKTKSFQIKITNKPAATIAKRRLLSKKWWADIGGEDSDGKRV